VNEGLRPGYGQLLAQARTEKNLSTADVAAKLKLTVRQVQAMEDEDASRLPADVFLRGFVRNYARLVGLNPDDFMLPLEIQATVSETITAPSEGLSLNKSGLQRWLLVPLAILVLFILFVALLYQWLRQGEDTLVVDVPVHDASMQQARDMEPPAAAAVAPPVADAPPAAVRDEADPGTEPPVVTTVRRNPTPADAPVPAEVAAAPIGERDEPVRAEPRASPAPVLGHVLRFQAHADAWVQVVDGQGRRYSRLIRAGGGDTIAGVAPFQLVVGEAAQVRLTYDGQNIDLTPFIGQRVARLTLE